MSQGMSQSNHWAKCGGSPFCNEVPQRLLVFRARRLADVMPDSFTPANCDMETVMGFLLLLCIVQGSHRTAVQSIMVAPSSMRIPNVS